ncbi:MAG TPA: LPXTG cell wall anchor domain-containing protein [Candidatus Limnocylindrales bacterium]|nr:LPXTG cell wall anchor domain-containing protein [Candidatus Limnocylindrales bacterium]
MVGAVAFGAVAVVGIVLAATTAQPDPAPAPRFVAGNVANCTQAGLSGTVLFGSSPDYPSNPTAGSGTVSQNGLTLNVTINAGFTASGIVVKGGPNANVYDGPFVGPITITGMQSPIFGSNIPAISHWFVCGAKTQTETPSPSPSETPSPTPPTTASSSGGGGLPVTGTATGGLILTGLALLVMGGAALLVARRRRDGATETETETPA